MMVQIDNGIDIWIRDYNPPRCFQKKISGRSKHNVTGSIPGWTCLQYADLMYAKIVTGSIPGWTYLQYADPKYAKTCRPEILAACP
jgi:hypothetical protein